MKRHFSFSGFTLIEVMVAAAVLAVLAAIAYPSYQRHVKNARMKQASAVLFDNARALEQFYARNRSFKADSTTWADIPFTRNGHFCFKMQGNAQGALTNSFTVKAVALDKDNEPRVLRINQDHILTICESSNSSCSDTSPYFSNANGTDQDCTVYE